MTPEIYIFFIALFIVAFFVFKGKTKAFEIEYFDLMEKIELAKTWRELYFLSFKIIDFEAKYYEQNRTKVNDYVRDLKATAKDRLKMLRNQAL